MLQPYSYIRQQVTFIIKYIDLTDTDQPTETVVPKTTNNVRHEEEMGEDISDELSDEMSEDLIEVLPEHTPDLLHGKSMLSLLTSILCLVLYR